MENRIFTKTQEAEGIRVELLIIFIIFRLVKQKARLSRKTNQLVMLAKLKIFFQFPQKIIGYDSEEEERQVLSYFSGIIFSLFFLFYFCVFFQTSFVVMFM